MKIKFESAAAMVASLGWVLRVISRRSSLPVLSCIRIEATGEGVRLRGTDLDRSLELAVDSVVVEAPGVAVVNAHKLAGVLAGMDGEFDMEGMAGKIRVTEKRGSVDLWCVDPLEFPVPPSFGDKFQFLEVDAKDLTRALKCGLATASRDESRYILNGVALERKQVAPLEVVATDGRRLAHCAMCISAADFVGCKVVPVAGVQVLSSLAGQLGEAECRLELTENLLRMQLVKGGSYVCKLLEGTFPNWRQVVPEMKGEPVALNVDEILAAINVSQWFGDSVSLTSRGGSLAVAARDAETGRSEWSLPLDLGDGFRRTFDQGFLSEGLAMMQGETKAWFGEEEGSAAVFTDTFAQYVLMPMRSADVQEGEG